MSLLAEEIVEEWLNRNGYFTIRGIKIGVNEIDLLAITMCGSVVEARHIEVQASVRPMSYLCPLTKENQKNTNRSPMNAKRRSQEELADGVEEWVNKKYYLDTKKQLRNSCLKGVWKYELVVHHVKYEEELRMVEKHGITIHRLDDIVKSLSGRGKSLIQSASGTDLLDLVMLGRN